MIKLYNIDKNLLVPSSDLESHIKVFISPSDNEMSLLKDLGIDEHDLTSSLDPEEVSRMEFYESGDLFIIWKVPRNYSYSGQLLFGVTSVGIFLTGNSLIFILPEEFRIFESKYLRNINTLMDVVLAFMYSTINHYYSHLRGMRQIANEIEGKISASLDNTYLLHMLNLSESLVYYINSLSSNQNVLIKLRESRVKIGLSKADYERIKDIIIDNRQCYREAKILAVIFSDLMDARASIVNNNMNVLIKNLTVINVIMLPLNFISGIGGMSEYTMMMESIGLGWPIGYLIFIVFSGILGFIIAYFINRYIGSFTRRISKKIKR